MSLLAVSLAILVAALSNVNALTLQEMPALREPVRKIIIECSAEYNISVLQLKNVKDIKSMEGIDPCAIGCVFKKAQYINNKGYFDAEKTKEVRETYVISQEDRQNFNEIAHECSAVNDVAVSDGNQGCERAVLLLACMAKHRDAILN